MRCKNISTNLNGSGCVKEMLENQEWMEVNTIKIIDILIIILLHVVTAQIATMIHELGHAIPALIFSHDDVKILLGSKRKNRLIHISRLSCV